MTPFDDLQKAYLAGFMDGRCADYNRQGYERERADGEGRANHYAKIHNVRPTPTDEEIHELAIMKGLERAAETLEPDSVPFLRRLRQKWELEMYGIAQGPAAEPERGR